MGFFDESNYQSAQERINAFWREYPKGRIINEIVSLTETDIIIKSNVYLDEQDMRPSAVDFAHERVTEKGVNATSHVENCSTSASARAISLLGGIFSPDKKRASREEIQKVARLRNWILEADDAYAAGNLQLLRSLRDDAVNIKAPADAIAHITSLGMKLKDVQENGSAPSRKDNTLDAPSNAHSLNE